MANFFRGSSAQLDFPQRSLSSLSPLPMLSATYRVCAHCRLSLLENSLGRRTFQSSAVLQRQKPKTQKSSSSVSAFRQLISRPTARPTRHADNVLPPLQRPQHHFHARKSRSDTWRISSPEQVRQKLNEGLYRWARLGATVARLKAMGITTEEARTLLSMFVDERPRTRHGWFPPEEDDVWQMARIQDDMAESLPGSVDRALTRRFMAWALETTRTRGTLQPSVYNTLASVQKAVDFTHPAEWYPVARMLKRKVHMHVGPTNSGKTHNALRALAASPHGVYASPLRLLAYEVFDRLNKGRIVPLNADPSAPPETLQRTCNLITGEETRLVKEDAPLLSCTVEMIDTRRRYDVAVIDEIQMLSDPQRGGAWTAAVLGIHAEEVHLCGEAGAVPLVQEMLKETGDELVVHRYERLTPLVMASKSLNGDLRKIEPGDCVVSFSRNSLFALKRDIEKITGRRCAIIYGRLPPEVRCEQAELFNDPDTGYDVLVGSDAIGMGLNLKIKRIIFESSWKYDGDVERTLSLSQLKQIAGRAGRYGLHGDDDGGIVTTLYDDDLPVVRKAVESKVVPVSKRAVLPMTRESYNDLEQLIRRQASFSSILDIIRSASIMAPCYTLSDLEKDNKEVLPIIDRLCNDYTLAERLRIMNAPVQWRDKAVAQAMEKFLRMYKKEGHVKFEESLKGLGLLEALEKGRDVQTSAELASGATSFSESEMNILSDAPLPPSLATALEAIHLKSVPPQIDLLLKMESLYRIAVVYMWFNQRLPLVFSQRDKALRTKDECEENINWCLERMKYVKGGKFLPRKEVIRSDVGATSSPGQESAKQKRDEKEGEGGVKIEEREYRVDGLDDAVPREEEIIRADSSAAPAKGKKKDKDRKRVAPLPDFATVGAKSLTGSS
ncbi:SUV3 [Sanghuangporus weigelae]